MVLCMQRSRPRMRRVSRDSYEGTKKSREFHRGGGGLKVRPLCFPFSFFLHFSFLFLLPRLARFLPRQVSTRRMEKYFSPGFRRDYGEKLSPRVLLSLLPRSFSRSPPVLLVLSVSLLVAAPVFIVDDQVCWTGRRDTTSATRRELDSEGNICIPIRGEMSSLRKSLSEIVKLSIQTGNRASVSYVLFQFRC